MFGNVEPRGLAPVLGQREAERLRTTSVGVALWAQWGRSRALRWGRPRGRGGGVPPLEGPAGGPGAEEPPAEGLSAQAARPELWLSHGLSSVT